MAKHKPTSKRKLYGYELKINRTGERGEKNWERVGGLFNSSLDAKQFKDKNYPTIKLYSVSAIRLELPVEERRGS